jgi:Sigma-70 region 2
LSVEVVLDSWEGARDDSFVSFFEAEYDGLFRTLLLLVGSRSEADELAQETMVRVYERWGRIQEMDSSAGYAYTVAFNLNRRRPPVTLHFLDRSVELQPYTYCYREGCVDGGPREPVPDVGTPPFVTIEYPLDGWSFTALFTQSGAECGRVQSVPLTPNGDGTFTLEPIGFAGDYNVSLFGRWRRGGDLSVGFRWTTLTDGPLPEPRRVPGAALER